MSHPLTTQKTSHLPKKVNKGQLKSYSLCEFLFILFHSNVCCADKAKRLTFNDCPLVQKRAFRFLGVLHDCHVAGRMLRVSEQGT